MIIAYNKGYDVDPEKFVMDLVGLFDMKGARRRGQELWVRCPFHSHGDERTASASFSLGGEHPGAFYCFGCKTKGSTSTILTKLFQSRQRAKLWLSENFKSVDLNEKRVVNKISPELPGVKQVYNLPLSLIDSHTDYFSQRGIPDDLVKKYRLMYSPERDAIIFPVWEENTISFYQVRYLHHETGLKWYIPKDAKARVFGKEFISSGTVYICESCFNALTLEKFGYQAVAMFGARFDDTKYELLGLPAKRFIIAYDGDDAGRKNARDLSKFLKDSGRLVEVLKMPDKKDINDFANLTQSEFDNKILEWRGRR